MSQETALILFEFVALIFALSFHECAHALLQDALDRSSCVGVYIVVDTAVMGGERHGARASRDPSQ